MNGHNLYAFQRTYIARESNDSIFCTIVEQMAAVTAHAYCTDVLYCGLGITAENDPSGCLSYVRDGVRVAKLDTEG